MTASIGRLAMRKPLLTTAALRGFTLLEMLVVMVILGLLSSVALPAMQRWHEAVQARSEGASLVEAMRIGAFSAGTRRLSLTIDASSFFSISASPARPVIASHLMLKLPEGWQVESVSPITFLGSGLCKSGHAILRSSRGQLMRLEVEAQSCEVSLQLDTR